MKLIVGLGNPGRKYEQTRHNVGFVVATKAAKLISASAGKSQFEAETAEGHAGTEKILFLWPQTYMNASGRSVRKALDFYKLVPNDLLVICDDLNLPSTRLRIRPSGSAGGQKGLADIINSLGTDIFARLRVGIDRPPDGRDVVDYVLGKLSGDEAIDLDNATSRAAQATIDWALQGTQHVMNHYNAAS
jgi:peptidyl-tRNA hydrolase, PTH1 family